ncbi:Na+/H+ antiporter subunit E [Thiomicrorhabdus sp. Kp2]|uniref:Na+/H+ antiporter subunit E n=1 Tax=Thiomicrorhabdus sp. Kp2 TaxID=1123518 RepID=UPI00040B6F06|nr:Na+/H+ antiporter subunit E [Thiomicrorhabdus sp. Kp2]
MKKILPHPILSLVLWLVWLLLNNTVAPGHILLGAILAFFIPLLTSGFWPEKVCIRYPFTLFKFVLTVLWDIMIANVIVAKLILGNKDKLQPTFLHIPLDIEQPLAISLLANTISLTPGTVSCDLSEDKKTLLVHGLHEEDPEATINEIKQRYEQPLKKVFESC